jgi:cytochrome c553
VVRAFLLGLLLLGGALSPAGAQSFDERLSVCLSCHGEKGQSENPEIPSLGAQPSPYALIQIYMFREKLRINEIMNEMAKGISDADLQKFADTIGKLPPPPPAPNPDAARMAKAATLVAQHKCNVCHTANIAGNDAVPRLAGQREDYLLKSLRDYKANTRNEYQPVMTEVIYPLKDEDFVELAYYLAHYK